MQQRARNLLIVLAGLALLGAVIAFLDRKTAEPCAACSALLEGSLAMKRARSGARQENRR